MSTIGQQIPPPKTKKRVRTECIIFNLPSKMRSSVLPIFCFPCVNTQIIQPQTIIVCFVFFLIICRSEFGTTNTDFSKFLVFCWEMLWPCLWLCLDYCFCFVTISVAYNKFSVFKKDFFLFCFLFVNLCCAFKNGKNFWLLDLRHLKMKTMKIWSIAVQTYQTPIADKFLIEEAEIMKATQFSF